MEHNQEIEKTINVISEIGRVEPSEELLTRLKNIPSQVRAAYDVVPKKIVWSVAASIIVLVVLNVFSMREYKHSKSSTETNTSSYFDYMKQL